MMQDEREGEGKDRGRGKGDLKSVTSLKKRERKGEEPAIVKENGEFIGLREI